MARAVEACGGTHLGAQVPCCAVATDHGRQVRILATDVTHHVVDEDADRSAWHRQAEQCHHRGRDVDILNRVLAVPPPLVARVLVNTPRRLAHDVTLVVGHHHRHVRVLVEAASTRHKASAVQQRRGASDTARGAMASAELRAAPVGEKGNERDVLGRATRAAGRHVPVVAHDEEGGTQVAEAVDELIHEIAAARDGALVRVLAPGGAHQVGRRELFPRRVRAVRGGVPLVERVRAPIVGSLRVGVGQVQQQEVVVAAGIVERHRHGLLAEDVLLVGTRLEDLFAIVDVVLVGHVRNRAIADELRQVALRLAGEPRRSGHQRLVLALLIGKRRPPLFPEAAHHSEDVVVRRASNVAVAKDAGQVRA